MVESRYQKYNFHFCSSNCVETLITQPQQIPVHLEFEAATNDREPDVKKSGSITLLFIMSNDDVIVPAVHEIQDVL